MPDARGHRNVARALGLVVTLSSAGVFAQVVDPDEARYQEAAQLRSTDQGAALVIYRELNERTHAPRALAQLGQLEAQMGRWLLADEHLAAALAAQGDPWIEPRRGALETNLLNIRSHVSELTVTVNVPGARLRVNDADVGALPLERPVRVAVGPLVVDVEADGYESARQTVEATPGSTRVEFALVRRVAREEPRVVTRVVTVTERVRERDPAGLTFQQGMGIGALTLGAIGLGTGVVALVLRNARVSAFTDARCYLNNGAVEGPSGAGCQSTYDTGTTMEVGSIVGFVGGGALTVAGAMLILLARPRGTTTTRQLTRFSCGVGVQGASCGGTF